MPPDSGPSGQAGNPSPSVFSRIIAGDLPGRFVWSDESVVAFLTVAPLRPGHTLVVPVVEVDHWIDVPAATWARCTAVAHAVGRAQQEAFAPTRIGLIVAGMEVPHCHIHVIPIDSEADLSFARADHSPDPAALDEAADRLRAALVAHGHAEATARLP